MAIVLKTPEEIESLRDVNCLLCDILNRLEYFVCPGRTPRQISERFTAMVRQAGATPIFLGYQRSADARPFPASLCVSVNPVVTHGVPDERLLRDGDLVNLDAGLGLRG